MARLDRTSSSPAVALVARGTGILRREQNSVDLVVGEIVIVKEAIPITHVVTEIGAILVGVQEAGEPVQVSADSWLGDPSDTLPAAF